MKGQRVGRAVDMRVNVGGRPRTLEPKGDLWPVVTNPEQSCEVCSRAFSHGSMVVKYLHPFCTVHRRVR